MRKRVFLSLTALLVALALSLGGCGYIDVPGYFTNLSLVLTGQSVPVAFDSMVYTRPDMTALETTAQTCCDIAETSEDMDEIEEAIWTLYSAYDDFYTMLNLADVHYCADLTDLYWQEEYTYCVQNSSQADAALDELYYSLAKSPMLETLESEAYFGEGFFDSYQGESVWDETFTALMTRESELISQYYDLSAQGLDLSYDTYYDTVGAQQAQLYVELVALRQDIAAYLGYDNYVDCAYDLYYYRDYTPEQAETYTQAICQTLTPLYRQVISSGAWNRNWMGYTEADTFDYVQQCAQAMGGAVETSFQRMADNGLYDISFGENKYDASFELFLYSYGVPYVFTNPDGSAYDLLTFAHEFGHFCNDDACGGSYAGTDVAEFFSQGMEYLSLCYGTEDQTVETMKLLDCLNTYVEQAAYATFEQQVYGLEGDALTVENVQALYAQVGQDFGFDTWGFDSREYVTVTHFFTNPMYIISYVVSNDAAFSLYQMEQAESGSGLALYLDNLASQESYFLRFVEDAGLDSPFDPDRLASVCRALEEVLT